MSIKSNIQKGKDLENFVAGLFESSGLDRRAVRQIGSGNGKRKGDVANDLGWTIECKNSKAFRFKDAADQVAREGMGYQKEAIIWHPPNRPMDASVVIINISDFIELLQRFKEPVVKGEDRQFKYKLDRLVNYAKDLIKELD